MNPSSIADKVDNLIVKTADDIQEYLGADNVPLECYQKDIDKKLEDLRDEVKKVINPKGTKP